MNQHVPKKFEGFDKEGDLSYDFVAVDELATIPQSAFEAVATMQMGLTAEQLEQAKQVPGVDIQIVRHQAKQSDMSNWVKPKWEIPTTTSTEEVHDCGNCLSYQPGTIVCRCDECNDDCVAWDPIPKKEGV